MYTLIGFSLFICLLISLYSRMNADDFKWYKERGYKVHVFFKEAGIYPLSKPSPWCLGLEKFEDVGGPFEGIPFLRLYVFKKQIISFFILFAMTAKLLPGNIFRDILGGFFLCPLVFCAIIVPLGIIIGACTMSRDPSH